MSRFVIYQRVSTDEQSLGLIAQLDVCREFVAKNTGELIGTFSDEGISGAASIEKRPGLLSAISALNKGDVLLVAKRDRLARDPMVLAMVEASVCRKGARIISVAGEGTGNDEPSSVLMRRLVDAFSEYERLIIKSRTRAALQAKKVRNERTGHIPFGYCLDEDGCHLRVDENEMRILKTIQGLQKEGFALRQIAEELNGRQETNRGNIWNHVSVMRVSRGKIAA